MGGECVDGGKVTVISPHIWDKVQIKRDKSPPIPPLGPGGGGGAYN